MLKNALLKRVLFHTIHGLRHGYNTWLATQTKDYTGTKQLWLGERTRYLLGDLRVHEVPVNQMVQEGGDIVGTHVLVVQIVGVLPDILKSSNTKKYVIIKQVKRST